MIRSIREEEYKILLELLKTKKNQDRLKTAIYARKSQLDETDTSLEMQINYCKEMIESCDLLELCEVFQEDNVSGMWDNRIEFKKMINDLCSGLIDVIVVYAWDRFSRKSSDLQHYREIVLASGGYIISGDSQGVIDSASSLFVFQIKANSAEFFARTSAERTYDTMRNIVKEQQRYVSGAAPYGYCKDSSGKLILDLDESIVVSQMFEKAISGCSLTGITKWLNNAGIKTKKGNSFSKEAVHSILQNKIYTGTYVYDKAERRNKYRIAIVKRDPIVVENAFPAIVSLEEFEIVQKMINNKNYSKTKESGYCYLLSGLVQCKECGKIMVGSSNKGR